MPVIIITSRIVDKGGVVTSGVGGEVSVVFSTPYVDTDYFISLTPGENPEEVFAMMKTGTKTVNGFTIFVCNDIGKAVTDIRVYWITGTYSNP